MSGWVPWSHDKKTGIKKSVRLESNGDITVHRSQDVGAILEENRQRRLNSDGFNASRDRLHVGHIPEIVRLDILAKEGIDIYKPEGEERLFKLLTDPDYSGLRTSDARVGISNGQIR